MDDNMNPQTDENTVPVQPVEPQAAPAPEAMPETPAPAEETPAA